MPEAQAQAAKATPRKHFGMRGLKLTLPFAGDPARHYAYINDENVAEMLDLGYTFEDERRPGPKAGTDVGTHISKVVGKQDDGQGQRAYLMSCPEELYQELQAPVEEYNREVAKQIRRGQVGRSGNDGLYVPRNGIKVGRG